MGLFFSVFLLLLFVGDCCEDVDCSSCMLLCVSFTDAVGVDDNFIIDNRINKFILIGLWCKCVFV